MKIRLAKPYMSLHGVVQGIDPMHPNLRFYFRTNKVTGEVTACKCPNQTKPPSAAQLAQRKRFAEQFAKGVANIKKHH